VAGLWGRAVGQSYAAELCGRVVGQDTVLDWGFGARL